MKKLLPLTLLLLFLLASCGSGDVPEGMQLASDGDADGFLLYVPEEYTVDRSAGIPTAVVSSLDPTSISGALLFPSEPDIPACFAASRADLEKVGENFTLETDGAALTVANRSAYTYVYSFVRGGVAWRVMQVYIPVGEGTGDGVAVLTYTGKSDAAVTGTVGYSDHMRDFEKVLQIFAFPSSRTPVTEAPADAPVNGLLLASTPKIANYELYVPASWTVDMKTGISSAYLRDDKTSVSVISYYPEGMTTVADYVEDKLTEYAVLYDSIRQVGEYSTLTVDGANAYRYEFIGEADGRCYRFAQVYILKFGGFHPGLYTLTYTASAEAESDAEALYAAHAGDLSTILSAFRFR